MPLLKLFVFTLGNDKVVVKKETTAALVHKQQARQQAALACLYESELALEAAVAKKGQENTEEAAAMNQLADEVAALTKIYQPIKGHAGKAVLLCRSNNDNAYWLMMSYVRAREVLSLQSSLF